MNMSTKSKKFVLLVIVMITIASMLAACGGAPTTQAPAATEAPGTQAPATEMPATEAPATESPAATEAPAGQGPFTIGISNPFISSEYRTQMIAELEEVNKEYMDKGITTDLVIESADTDVAGQIQQLQNLMAKNVDAILVNPGDVSGLNATLQEAVDKGIIVISVDQELNVPNVYNVGIDQKEWAKTSAKWLADKLGGKGNVVEIEGFPGHPANVARMEGVDEVFKDYPDIKVLAKDTGKWDEATGQQVMSNFLSAYPNLDGYWTQDGMAIGALQAVMAANPAKWPQGVGEGRCQYLKLWQEALATNPDFDSIAVANHPGVSPTGLRIAVNMLMGKKVDTSKLGGANGLSFVIPLAAVITKDNLDEGLAMCEGKPDAYLLDNIMTDEEVQQYFVQ
jgi:ribose transport system substrate-binding protein